MQSSALPDTPGRGRSRFSKALPTPPPQLPLKARMSPSWTSPHSPLPPLPRPAMAAPMKIPRRPIAQTVPLPRRPSTPPSVSSASSGSPASSGSVSDGSYKSKDSMSWADEDTGPVPPLPPKDRQRQQPANAITGSPVSSFQSSPPPVEIWKRRSASTRAVPELKLDRSNGSTAGVPLNQHLPSQSYSKAPSQEARVVTGRKPVATRPAPPPPDVTASKLSNQQNMVTITGPADHKDEAGSQQYPYSNRPPTPDYSNADKEQPMTPQTFSPISPAPPQTPPNDTVPEIPARSESRKLLLAAPIFSKSTTIASSESSSETITISSEMTVIRSPQAKKTLAGARILIPEPTSSPEEDSEENDSSTESNVQVPGLDSPISETSHFSGPKLDIVKLDCYQSHKFMRRIANKWCPVACMTCQENASDVRWKCSWCCLTCCGSCMKVLASTPARDLRLCLEEIAQ